MRRSMGLGLLVGAVGGFGGCGDGAGGRADTGAPGITSAGMMATSTTELGASSSADVGTGGSGAASDAGDDEGPGLPAFDLGIQPDIPLEIEDSCTKVDFLFVIDNSGSMAGDQANLIANFPAFITGIQAVLSAVDEYQVGVVTTDTYDDNIGGCRDISSLVVRTGGDDSSRSDCGPYAEGFNFMTQQDDLATSFSCAAQVGTDGSSDERPMQATVEAVQRVEGDPGECNEGYIRDDALLVIVIITDESDEDSSGNTQEWFEDVVAAKGGLAENVVVVSLINTPGGNCGSDDAHRISEFTTMFGENGFQADVCTEDYGPIFQQAVGVIESACDNFMPPG